MTFVRRFCIHLWRMCVRFWQVLPTDTRKGLTVLAVALIGLSLLNFLVQRDDARIEAQNAKDVVAYQETQRKLAARVEAARVAFAKLTPAEHFAKAQAIWKFPTLNQTMLDEAIRHLDAIPSSAPESPNAAALRSSIRDLRDYSAQVERKTAVARQQAAEAEKSRVEQQNRDADAETSSYIPTTLRVDTDMNSYWLDQEERVCQTSAGEKNRVSYVSCNPNAKDTHNIPVTFWGGVDRGKVSDWKCRREGAKFVCRAIN